VKGAEPSARGDVYALGVILHEVLLGRRPDKATGPETLRKLLPGDVLDVLVKALAFDPADRFANARELRNALAALGSALTARGVHRLARVTGRYFLAGLAAFFVGLRYLSVLALLSLYATIVGAAIVQMNPLFLLAFLPMLLLHVVVRWEGPETAQEAALRQKGHVVSAQGPRFRR
jgi:hypothetical protein